MSTIPHSSSDIYGFDSSSSNGSLAEITRDKLLEFAARRARLTCLRGLGTTAFVVAVSAVASLLLDAIFDHEAARWLGALLIYGTVIPTIYLFVIKPWKAPLHIQREAKEFEQRDPELKSKLLSAVELSELESKASDSIEFRSALQNDVAACISPVEVTALLPLDSVRREVLLVAGIGCLSAVLCLVPSVHFPQRMLRVLFPFANLGRVSQYSIEIVRPAPASKTVPKGDVIAIMASVEGIDQKRPSKLPAVWLETDIDGSINQFEMSLGQEPGQQELQDYTKVFETTLVAETDRIRYRVRCMGATTAWHLLNAKPRPNLNSFRFRIQPPEYVGKSSQVIDKPDGNLDVLANSTIRIGILADSPLSKAQIRWEDESNLELNQESDGIWSTRHFQLPDEFVDERRYRVHLRHEDTNFANDFAQSFGIQVIPDKAPEIRWVKPYSSIVVAASEIVDLGVQIRDEFPVAKVERQIQINNQSWQSTVVDVASLRESAVDFRGDPNERAIGLHARVFEYAQPLDLLPLKLKAGDRIQLRLQVTDLAGNSAVSDSVLIQISPTELDLELAPFEVARIDLAIKAHQFSERISAIAEQAEASWESQVDQLEFELKTYSGVLVSLAAKAAAANPQIVKEVELRRTSIVLQQLLAEATTILQERRSLSEGSAKKDLVRFARQVEELSRHLHTYVREDRAERHSRQLQRLARAHAELAGTDLSDEALHRQLAVLNQQVELVKVSMLESTKSLPEATTKSLLQSTNNLQSITTQTQRELEYRKGDQLRELIASTAQRLNSARVLSQIDNQLDQRVKAANQWFNSRVTATRNTVLKTIDPNEEGATESAVSALNARREIVRNSQNFDADFARDLGQTSRALQNAPASSEPQQTTQLTARIREIATAIQVLESASDVKNAKQHLERLKQIERWELADSAAGTIAPALWRSFAFRIEQANRIGRGSFIPDRLLGELDRLRWNQYAQRINERVSSRIWQATKIQSASVPVESLLLELNKIRADIEPYVQQARKILQEAAPTVSELADSLAKQTQRLAQESQSLSEQSDRKSSTQLSSDLRSVEQQGEELESPSQALKDALVDLADAQNLLDQSELRLAKAANAGLEITEMAQDLIENSLAEISNTREQVTSGNDTQADDPKQQLQEAAAKQLSAAKALTQLANAMEHSANLQNNANASESQLNQSGRSLEDISRELDRQLGENTERESYSDQLFDDAERLADLASQNPQEVLEALERELQKSEPMQSEMSEIAQATAKNAFRDLQQAAESQDSIQPTLEASDPKLAASKRLLLHDIQTTREDAFQNLGLLIAESRNAATLAKNEKTVQELKDLEAKFKEALSAVEFENANAPFEELKSGATKLAEALASAQDTLASAAKDLTESMDQKIHRNGAELNNRRRQMIDRQKRINTQDVRNHQQSKRSQRQRLQNATGQTRRATQQVTQAAKDLKKVRDQISKKPDADGLQSQLKEKQAKLEIARDAAEASKAVEREIENRIDKASEDLEEVQRAKLPELDSVNPSSELGAALAERGRELSSRLADRLSPWTDQNVRTPDATSRALEEAVQREGIVQQDVSSVADQLARASRHEERLQNEEMSSQLGAVAKGVQEAARSELGSALNQLSQAQTEAKANGFASGTTTPESIQRASSSVSAGSDALARSASELGDLLADAESPPQSSRSSQPSNPMPGSDLMSPRQKAQLLDELDQRLSSSGMNLGEKEDDAQSSSQTSSPSAPPNTLAEAAKRLARMMRQSREPTPANANSDLATTTDADMANADPQPPVDVRVLKVDRIDGDWGNLQSKRAEEAIDSDRDRMSPRFRQQVDAYFRRIAREENK